SPGRKSTELPMLSAVPGNVPGASSQRAKPLTWYVPFEITPAVVIVQVPPPVTTLDVSPSWSLGTTKVPDPVSVIVSPILSCADAWPPGFTVDPGVDRLMMSQRSLAFSRLSFLLAVANSGHDRTATVPREIIARTERRCVFMFPPD